MKAEDVEAGYHKAGTFTINVANNKNGHEDYFFVMVTTSDNFYVHLVQDERFQCFKHFAEFGRALTEPDLVEYNEYVNTKQLVMPMFKLHRQSIATLINKCQTLSKTIKKKK
ncbi:MAG TPA: hypothetical protein VII94_03365 [Candidatus Saccharimonadales bacterium]